MALNNLCIPGWDNGGVESDDMSRLSDGFKVSKDLAIGTIKYQDPEWKLHWDGDAIAALLNQLADKKKYQKGR
jgi:hypothetical protein